MATDGATAEGPPRFAPNVVQGKSYDRADLTVAPNFSGLLQRILGAGRSWTSAAAAGWLNGFMELKDYLGELPHAWFLRDG